jgi:PilZ domain
MAEARAGKRFPLQLPIRIGGKDGVTRNVSAAGIYLDAEAEMAVGSTIELDLTLPAEIVGGESDVHVLCTGHVVRVDVAGRTTSANGTTKHSGLACVIDYYKMVRADKTC